MNNLYNFIILYLHKIQALLLCFLFSHIYETFITSWFCLLAVYAADFEYLIARSNNVLKPRALVKYYVFNGLMFWSVFHLYTVYLIDITEYASFLLIFVFIQCYNTGIYVDHFIRKLDNSCFFVQTMILNLFVLFFYLYYVYIYSMVLVN